MATIHKYQLDLDDSQILTMPEGARALTVQVQTGAPMLWALVHPDRTDAAYEVRTYGTGHTIALEHCALTYVGTYQLHGGGLVFHVFIGPA